MNKYKTPTRHLNTEQATYSTNENPALKSLENKIINYINSMTFEDFVIVLDNDEYYLTTKHFINISLSDNLQVVYRAFDNVIELGYTSNIIGDIVPNNGYWRYTSYYGTKCSETNSLSFNGIDIDVPFVGTFNDLNNSLLID